MIKDFTLKDKLLNIIPVLCSSILGYFLYWVSPSYSAVHHFGLYLHIITYPILLFFFIFSFLSKELFKQWYSFTTYFGICIILIILFAPVDSHSDKFLPLDKSQFTLVFLFSYTIFFIFLLVRSYLLNLDYLKSNNIHFFKIFRLYILSDIFKKHILLISISSLFLIYLAMVKGYDYDFETSFIVLFIFSLLSLFWHTINFYAGKKKANKWGLFVLYTFPPLFLLMLSYGCDSSDWLCPSRELVFLVLSFILYIPFGTYFLAEAQFAKTKIHPVYQTLFSLLLLPFFILGIPLFFVYYICSTTYFSAKQYLNL